MKNKPKMKMFLVALVIMGSSATSAWALIAGGIVFDPTAEKTRIQIAVVDEKSKYAHFIETLYTLRDQFYQLRESQKYWEKEIYGMYKDPLQVLRNEFAERVPLGTDMNKLGWDVPDEFRRVASTMNIKKAIDELADIIEARRPANSMIIRESLEELYGKPVPTRGSGRVEAAMRDMASTMTFLGEANKQIQVHIKQYQEINQMITEGGLPPDQIARLEVVAQQHMNSIELLKAQSGINESKLMMHQLGFKLAEVNNAERRKIEESTNREAVFDALMLTPSSIGRRNVRDGQEDGDGQ